MNSRVFEVPVDAVVEFADVLVKNELGHLIIGAIEGEEDDDYDFVVIEVDYERDQRTLMHDLQDIIDDYTEEDEEEDEDDEDE